MKKQIVLAAVSLLIVASLLVGYGCGDEEPAPDEKAPIKIAIIEDLTGAAAALGVRIRDTAVAYMETLNNEGGIDGHEIEWVVLDSKTDTGAATLAGERACVREKVLAIVGPTCSHTSLASSSVSEREQVVHLSSSACADALTQPVKPYHFRSGQAANRYIAEAFLELAVEQLGYEKLAFLITSYSFGTDMMGVAETMMADVYGLEPYAVESTELGGVTFAPQVMRLQDTDPDCVVVVQLTEDTPTAIKNIDELGWDIPIIGMVTITQELINLRAGAGEDRELHVDIFDNEKPEAIEAYDLYEDYYGVRLINPDVLKATSAMKVLRMGLESALASGELTLDPARLQEDRKALRDAIEGLSSFTLPSGAEDSVFGYGPNDHDAMQTEDFSTFVNRGTYFEVWDGEVHDGGF